MESGRDALMRNARNRYSNSYCSFHFDAIFNTVFVGILLVM
jgi:hypothetical protein